MAYVTQYVAGDNRLVLGAEEFVRKFSFGTAWTKIRLGARVTCTSPGSNVSNCGLALGVCEGDTNTFSSPTTTNYIGRSFGRSGAAWTADTWNHNAGPYFLTSGGDGNHTYLQKDTSGLTTAIITPGNTGVMSASRATSTSMFVDVLKQFGKLTVVLYVSNSSAFISTRALFLKDMELDGPPTNSVDASISANTASRTSSLPAYTWDTLSIVWTKNTMPMEILDLAVSRFY